MKRVYIGDYYKTKDFDLIKIISKGYDRERDCTIIIFAPVRTGGFCDEPLAMEEQKLISTIVSNR